MPKKTPETQLTFQKLKQKNKKYHEMETFELHDGETVEFYPLFSGRKIQALLKDYGQLMEQAQEKGLLLTEELQFQFLNFMCIKHFTNLKQYVPDEIEKQVQFMELLIDEGYFEEILNECFSVEEVYRVLDEASKLVATYQSMENLGKLVQDHVEKLDLKNKQIFENVMNKKKQIPMQ